MSLGVDSSHVNLEESNDPNVNKPRRKSLSRQLTAQASIAHIKEHKKKYTAGCVGIVVAAIVVGVVVGVGVGIAVHNAVTNEDDSGTQEQQTQNAQAESAVVNLGQQSTIPAGSSSSRRRLSAGISGASVLRGVRSALERHLTERHLADVSSFSPTSDYHLQPTNYRVEEPSNKAFQIPNMIMCMLSMTRADKFFNMGPYMAKVDANMCQESSSSSDQVPSFDDWTIEATSPAAGKTTGNYELKAWLHIGSSQPPMELQFHVTVPKEKVTFAANPDNSAEVDVREFTIMIGPEASMRATGMDLAIVMTLRTDDATMQETFQFHFTMRSTNPSTGEVTSQVQTAARTYNRNSGGGISVATYPKHTEQNQQTSVAYTLGFSNQYVRRDSTEGGNTSMTCLDRSTTVPTSQRWNGYGLYDSTGAQVKQQRYISLKKDVDGHTVRASLSTWGLHLYRDCDSNCVSPTVTQADKDAFVDGLTVSEEDWQDDIADKDWTLSVKNGVLKKHTKITYSGASFTGQTIMVETREPCSWANADPDCTMYTGRLKKLMFKSDGKLYNTTGHEYDSNLIPVDGMRAQIRVFGDHNEGLVTRATDGTMFIVLSRSDVVAPGSSSAPTNSLACVNAEPAHWWENYPKTSGCIDAASLATAQPTGGWGTPEKSKYTAAYGLVGLKVPGRSNFSEYTFDSATGILKQGDNTVQIPKSNTDFFVGTGQCGSNGGSGGSTSSGSGTSATQCKMRMFLMEATAANYQALGCTGDQPCTSADFEKLDVYYEWTIGQGYGTELISLKDPGSSTFKTPANSLPLTLSVPASTTSFSGTDRSGSTMLVGFEDGRLEGMPTMCFDKVAAAAHDPYVSQWGWSSCYDPNGGSQSYNSDIEEIDDFLLPEGTIVQNAMDPSVTYVLKPREIMLCILAATDPSACSGIDLSGAPAYPTGSDYVQPGLGAKPTDTEVKVVAGVIVSGTLA